MESLSWEQVNRWRIWQHGLLERAGRQDLLQAVRCTGGIQAQVMSAAELALWARLDGFVPDDAQNALWRERALVKTWAMRGTLHLLPASDFPYYIGARSAYAIHRVPSYYRYHGVTPDELDAIIEGIPEVLSDVPMTREQLAEAVAGRANNPNLRQVLLSGWGALLKPSAFRGDICFGPNQGQNVTFVRPNQWIGAWQAAQPHQAIQEMARRYLAAYGPAKTEDFARWWGLQASQAKQVFRSLGDEIEMVDVEGWQAWALASTLEPMKTLEAPFSVRLVPPFDAYVVGAGRGCEPVLAKAFQSQVYHPQGWISAVVLVDGRMAGVWEYELRGQRLTLKVEMFAQPDGGVEQGLQVEAERLGKYFDAEVELVYGK
jgi:uncharacterized protein YcaQ